MIMIGDYNIMYVFRQSPFCKRVELRRGVAQSEPTDQRTVRTINQPSKQPSKQPSNQPTNHPTNKQTNTCKKVQVNKEKTQKQNSEWNILGHFVLHRSSTRLQKGLCLKKT